MKTVMVNSTLYENFHLLAFSRYEKLQVLLFVVFFLIYMFTVLGNLIITALVCLESKLHTPMYFFLCNLSVQDVVYISATLPKLLAITLTGDTSISFKGCITQMFLFIFCIETEFFLLTSMSYDRYVAICRPLHYPLIMNKRTCTILATASWLIGILNSAMYAFKISVLSFCNSKDINHFYCDMKAILNLACNDVTNINLIIFIEGVLIGFLPFALILVSYIYIISAIIKTCTSAGRVNAFSRCSSHITSVLLFCLSSLSSYMKPQSENSRELDKLISVLYVALVPMLNPLIYSLRNKEVLNAIKRVYR
ncbi:olfactory receptor 13F1-like [Spea bombifrons]|uniref:olfactory receptor 13F1-like n=1 Tax=Spea bombifrons TaxID=233779 RepID=UPI0023493B44|nr:olfactory receptor 13F1-like [Spea bombifrons]